MRAVLVFVLGCSHAFGCTPPRYRHAAAVDCAMGDDVCGRVEAALEHRRHSTCRMDIAFAGQQLVDIGVAALPHLERAFDDPNTEVATFAMAASRHLGAETAFADWCGHVSDRLRISMCRAALEQELDLNLEGACVRH